MHSDGSNCTPDLLTPTRTSSKGRPPRKSVPSVLTESRALYYRLIDVHLKVIAAQLSIFHELVDTYVAHVGEHPITRVRSVATCNLPKTKRSVIANGTPSNLPSAFTMTLMSQVCHPRGYIESPVLFKYALKQLVRWQLEITEKIQITFIIYLTLQHHMSTPARGELYCLYESHLHVFLEWIRHAALAKGRMAAHDELANVLLRLVSDFPPLLPVRRKEAAQLLRLIRNALPQS